MLAPWRPRVPSPNWAMPRTMGGHGAILPARDAGSEQEEERWKLHTRTRPRLSPSPLMSTTMAERLVEQEAQYVTSGVVRLTRPQLVGTVTGLLLGALLAAIDQTIVGTAEPRIIASLSGFDRYPWVATAYLLTSTLSVPIFSSLSDMHGRKPFFLSGCILFVTASALCGMTGTLTFVPFDGMGQLIVFRSLQGVGAGMVMGLLFTIIGDIFSPSECGRYVGLFSAVWGISSIFGPTLGGWLTDQWSWRACFWVNLPVGAIAVAAIYFE